MAILNWNYLGVFPNGAESSGSFWGYRGIKSYAGDPYPHGTLSGETEVIAPTINTITCTAVNTIAYQWQKYSGGNWSNIVGETDGTYGATYLLGEHGTYKYRCICYGWLGTFTTDAIEITVTEPEISAYLTSTASTIAVGEEAIIELFITPYPDYAKSFKWQTSADAETWTDIAEIRRTHNFTGESAGTVYFRVIATQYDDVTVTTNELSIEVTSP